MAKKFWETFAVFLLMLGLAVLSTYPLILHFDTGLPYAPFGGGQVWNRSGDQIQLMYWFWLVKENFIGNITPFHSNPFEFNMVLPHVSSGMNTVPLAFIYMLFSPLGDIAAYNCTILSSYVLTGVFMYLLVHLYSGSRAGALLAAIIFTFAPSRMIGFASGHAYGLLFWCYPFILFFLEKGIQTKKIRYGIVSGLGLIFLSMIEPHLIYYICVFLGLYIPIRLLALFPILGEEGDSGTFVSFQPFYSLAIILGAGVAATVYAQSVFFYRDAIAFYSPLFQWVVIVYPCLLLFVSLCLTAVYQRLTILNFRESLTAEAISLTPLLLLFPLILLLKNEVSLNSGLLVLVACVTVVSGKLWVLRRYLLSMAQILRKGLWERKWFVIPVLPLVLSMGGIVYWMAGSKVKQVSTTIADGGRTLDDVRIFSAHLSDLFVSTSPVYIGVIPAAIGGALLCMLLFSSLLGKQRARFVNGSEFLRLFYIAVAACCLVLSLGLAFDDISLYALFYNYFPFFNYPRVSDRIITLALFSLAIAIGFVIRAAQQRCYTSVSRGILTVLVLLATGFQLRDYNVFKPMGINVLDQGQDVYKHVQENIDDGLLLEIPLWPGDSHQSSLYLHYVMFDNVRRVNGCSPMVLKEYIDTVFEPLALLNQGRLTQKRYELLQELGVKFITVHNNRDIFLKKVSPFEPMITVRRLKNSPYLEYIDIDNKMYFKTFTKKSDRLHLFRVKAESEITEDTSRPAWYDMPYFYDIDTRFYRQTGSIVKDKASGRRVFQAVEGQDKPGFLMYGPYIAYPPGEYQSCFTLATDAGAGNGGVRVEVSQVMRGEDVAILASRQVEETGGNNVFENVCLDFSLVQKQTIEFRAYYYGAGTVSVEKVKVNRAGVDSPLYLLEAESMVGDTGNLVFADDASGGKVIEGVAGKSTKADLVYGPNRTYTRGLYRVTYFLRTEEGRQVAKTIAVASVIVSDESNNTVFAQRKISMEELSGKSFVGVDMDFQLLHDQELSFRVRFLEKANVQLDRIVLEKR